MPLNNVKKVLKTRVGTKVNEDSQVVEYNVLTTTVTKIDLDDDYIKQLEQNTLAYKHHTDYDDYDFVLIEKYILHFLNDYKNNTNFNKKLLEDFSQDFYDYFLLRENPFNKIIIKNKLAEDFVFFLAKTIFKSTNSIEGIDTAFSLLQNYNYTIVKKEISEIRDIVREITKAKILKYSIIIALYNWELDTLLFEYLLLESPYTDNHLQELFIDECFPLRANVAKYIVENTHIYGLSIE